VAYDEQLADRVRDVLLPEPDLTQRKMFGGLAFMLEGHMCCGVVRDELMLRLGIDGAEEALGRDHVRPMDFTGKPMTGMVFVSAEGCVARRCVAGSSGRPGSCARSRRSVELTDEFRRAAPSYHRTGRAKRLEEARMHLSRIRNPQTSAGVV